MWRTKGASFTAFAVWGWVTTAYTSLVAASSDWAVGVDGVLTFLALYGTRIFINKPGTLPWLIAGGMAGTWVGLRWP